jgi:outer membrane protein
MRGRAKSAAALTVALVGLAIPPATAFADSLEEALSYTYANNPQINAQRALVRATDENVATALAGYRPRASATASVGVQSLDTTIKEIGSTTLPTAPASYFSQSGYNFPHGFGATISQTLYNGFQTSNRTRMAEAQVLSARESLRNVEQNVLLNAVIAYMNLLRDTAILELQRSNVTVLQEQLRQSRQRLEAGNVTATDVAQSESRLAVGRTQVFAAQASYEGSRAVYRQIIGTDPVKLIPASPVDRYFPNAVGPATAAAMANHPTVTAAQHNVDIALLQVKVAEGALYPNLTVQGQVQKNYEQSLNTYRSMTASATAQLSVPIYQGGAEYAAIRQAKETQGQRQMDVNVARDQARATFLQAWAQLDGAKSSIESTRSQVKAAEAALNGVREEARLGQRTTLDVLNAQQELVSARIAMVSAQRDRVVNSYSVMAAVGRLSPQVLGLSVPGYDATVHYHQVRDAWAGVRTPDGR